MKNKKDWEEILDSFSVTFPQSWQWGEMHKSLGFLVFRVGIKDNKGDVIGAFQVIGEKTKRGFFWIVPHGPLAERGKERDVLAFLVSWIKRGPAQKIGGDVIRVQPYWERGRFSDFSSLGFVPSSFYLTAQDTWEIDLAPSLEEILREMRKTTRYLIKQSYKNPSLSVVFSQKKDDLPIFYDLLQKTAKRERFTIPSFEFLYQEFSSFLPEAWLGFSFLKKDLLAGVFIIGFKGTVFYHHGASVHTRVPATYRLQWEVICKIKKEGYKLYNMWGVAPKLLQDRSHPWWGLTLFKTGFGGYKTELEGCWDYPLSWKRYLFIQTIERTRRFLRGV